MRALHCYAGVWAHLALSSWELQVYVPQKSMVPQNIHRC